MAIPIATIRLFHENNAVESTSQTRATTTLKKSKAGRRFFPGLARRDPIGDDYWFHNEASDIATYEQMTTSSADVAEVLVDGTLNDTDNTPIEKLMKVFVTDVGEPGESTPLDGKSWTFNLSCLLFLDDLNTTEKMKIYWYKRSSGGTETLINSGFFNVNNTTKTLRTLSISSPKVPLLADDRIVIKVFARFESADIVL